jgi:hypothetical protein
MNAGKETINLGLRFELADDPGQGRPVVVGLRVLHPPLSIFVIEEGEHDVKRLLGIVHHIGKRPTLHVTEELFARHNDS